MRRWVAIVCALLVCLWPDAARGDEPTSYKFAFVEPGMTADGVVIEEVALSQYAHEMLIAAARAENMSVKTFDLIKLRDELTIFEQKQMDVAGPVEVVQTRLGKVGLSKPILLTKGAAFYKAENAVSSISGLKSKRIGVVTGTASQRWSIEREIKTEAFDSVKQGMEAVRDGRIDVLLTSEVGGCVELSKGKYEGIRHSVMDEGRVLQAFAFALQLGDKARLEKLNHGLQVIEENGVAHSIFVKYYGEQQKADTRGAWIWILSGLCAVGAIAFVVMRYRLHRQSKDLAGSEEQHRLMAENLSGLWYRYLLLPSGERKLLSTNSLFPVWQTKYPSLAKDVAFEDAILAGVHAEDADRLKKAISQSRESMQPMEVEFRLQDKTGAYQWIHARSFASKHPDGIVWQGILLNVTHQRQLAASLRESEVKFQEIVEHCHDGILAVSQPMGLVVEANAAAAAALGCGRDVLIGSSLATSLPEMKGRLAAGFGAAVEEKVQHRGADGRLRDLEVRIKPMEFGGKEAAIILLRDVTERERVARERARLEMEMARTQKLEGLGVMAGGIAHDFNNILVGILGSLSLAELQVEEGSPAADTIKLVQRSAGRAADLTSKLLAYSGGAAIEKKPVDLRSMLASSRELLEMAAGRRATFSIKVPEYSVTIMGDAVQLGQVAMNLVSNAAEAITHQNGKVEVILDVVRLDGTRPRGLVGSDVPTAGEYARLSVKDNGSGISDETMQRIFEPFVTTKFAGRGLGLAASIGIVRAHRGAMCLTTATGEGTEFQVVLPLAETQAAATVEVKPVKREISAANNRTVLVVDDEQIVRETLSAMLRSLKANVIEADGGDKALDILRDGADADCVLLDLTMPGKDGLKTLAEIRKMRPKLPVILCSGFTEMPELAANSMVSFLAKPYTVDELAAQIKRAVATV